MFIQALMQRGALLRPLRSLVTEYFKHAVQPLLSTRDTLAARDKANDFVKNKLRFEVKRSRNLLMIPDESGLLNAGEVFIQYSKMDATDVWPAEPGDVLDCKVVVCRSPAYHGRHVLVMTAVGVGSEHGRKVFSALGHLHDGVLLLIICESY